MNANRIPIVTYPAEITTDWMNKVIQHIGHDVVVGSVASRPIGTGQTAHSERVVIEYQKWDGKAPTSLVAKLPHPNPTSRITNHQHGAYTKEYGFYKELVGAVKVHTPGCLYADINPANSDFVILLEDMAPAHQGDQMEGCDVDVAQRAMMGIAGLHAPLWGSASLLDYKFMSGSPGSGWIGLFTPEIYGQLWQGFLERYGERLTPEIVRVGEGLLKHLPKWIQPYQGPLCPTHGDFRLDNILISDADPNAPICIIDWQTIGLWSGAADVSYFLGAGLLPEARRNNERELVRVYYEALLSLGVKDYGADRLWRDYVWFTYLGYFMAVVASMIVARTERGDDMFMTMAHRHGQHAFDLDAEKLLAAA